MARALWRGRWRRLRDPSIRARVTAWAIATAHSGSPSVTDRPDGRPGARFVLRLPMSGRGVG
jgi:hypothetical protein